MSELTAIRPALPVNDMPQNAGRNTSAADIHAQAQAQGAAGSESAAAASPASRSGTTTGGQDADAHLSEASRARLLATQQAYVAAARAAGFNPLIAKIP